jgi:hypothetical protein
VKAKRRIMKYQPAGEANGIGVAGKGAKRQRGVA